MSLWRNILRLACVLGLAVGVTPAVGATPATVTDGTLLHGTGAGGQYLAAPAGSLSLQAARQRFAAGEGRPLPASSTFGYRRDEIWVAVPLALDQLAGRPTEVALLAPDLLEAELWALDENGSAVAHALRGALHRTWRFVHHPILSLPAPVPSRLTLVVRMRGEGLLHFDAMVGSAATLVEATQPDEVFNGVHAGIMMLLVIYHMMVYVALRRRVYLSYVVYAATMVVQALISAGWLDGFFGLQGLLLRFEAVVVALPALPALLFSLDILNLHSFPRLYRTGLALAAWSVVVVGLTVVQGAEAIELCQASFLVDLAFLLTAAVVALRHGEASAAAFLVGWSGFGLTIIAWALTTVGLLPESHLAINAPHYGNIFEFLCLSRAIVRHLERLRAAETRAARSAEESHWYQHLVRTISHDLANPLLVATEFARFGLEAETPEQMRRALQRVTRAAATMQAITGQVRTLASLESGKLVLELRPVALGPLVEEVRLGFGEALARKRLRLTVEVEDPTLVVRADPTTLVHSVLANLISNAIKFSEVGGEVRLAVRAAGDRVVVEVGDRGVGMRPELLARLFDPTQRTSERGTAGEKGTGFGMPLVKRFVELHEATIEVESEMGRGTTVRLSFPRASGDQGASPLVPRPTAEERPSGPARLSSDRRHATAGRRRA